MFFPTSNERAKPLPATPPQTSPCPRATSDPSYTSIHHRDVHLFLNHLDFIHSSPGLLHHYSPPSTPTIFALAALSVFSWPQDRKFAWFWGVETRAHTARSVQAVLESGEHLVIPFLWPGVAGALSVLAAGEARVAAVKKRKAAVAAGAKEAEPPQKVQRVTRASVRQQQKTVATAEDASGPSVVDATSPSSEKGRPQRTSARKQQQREKDAAMQASVRPTPNRALSTSSQDSSETAVASSSPSRAASVASADTVVDITDADSVICGDKKGKGRELVPETSVNEAVAPIAPENEKITTRSRTRKTSTPKRVTPHLKTKPTGQTGAVRRAPTGKRKLAKNRVPVACQ